MGEKATKFPPDRWWDLPAVLLLVAALTTTATRLVVTKWTDHLGLVQTLTFLGAAAGVLLGQSRFPARIAVPYALTCGLFSIPWQLGLTLEYGTPWAERLTHLVSRVSVALDQLARHEAVPDPVLFLLMVATLTWALSVHAGYALTRHGGVWRVVIPSGVALVVIQTYDPFKPIRTWFLAIYVFLSLLLLARMAYLRRHVHWQEAGISLPPYLGLEFGRVILLTAALLVLLAWATPALAAAVPAVERVWHGLTRPWDYALDFLSNAFASLTGEANSTGGRYYGEYFSLGRGNLLSNTPVLTVQAPPEPPAGVRYYWRARAYDHYADGQWVSTLTVTQPVNPIYFDLNPPGAAEGRVETTFVLTPATGIATLYTAPQPLWVSHPAQADLAHNPDGTTDLSALHATPHLRAGESYQARSSLSVATEAQLRAAGTDYPSWITNRYLQVSPNVTVRTRQLAREIAADLDNPYDITVAVTEYLRDEISYVDHTPHIPSGREPVDWFLFDLRRGFCNYYASAEIVLLRSLGIPARLATGFAQGVRQGRSGIYTVYQQHAHAWPEVYFPGLGWVEFEPTASQPALYRPSGQSSGGVGVGPITPGEGGGEWRDRWEDRLQELLTRGEDPLGPPAAGDAASRFEMRAIFPAALVALGLGLALIALVWHILRRRGAPPLPVVLEGGLRRLDLEPPTALRMWAIRAALSPMGRAYIEISLALARLGTPPAPSDTPAERASALVRLLPRAVDHIRRLLTEYQATAYGPRPGDLDVARRAGRVIRCLSWWTAVKGKAEHALRPLRLLGRRLVQPSYQSFR